MPFFHVFYVQIVELVGVAGAMLCLFGQTRKHDHQLKLFLAFGFSAWMLHFALIGGAAGMAAVFGVASLRQAILVYWQPVTKRDRIMFACSCITLAVTVGLFWWSGLTTLITLAGLCWSSYVFTCLSGISLRIGLFVNNLIWFTGAAVAVSYTGMAYPAIAAMFVAYTGYAMRKRVVLSQQTQELAVSRK